MRYWAVTALVLVALVLQTTAGNYLAIAGVAPDVLLALTLSFGLLFGWQVGAGTGLAAGLLLDLTFGRFVGLHGLSLGLTGLLVGLGESSVVKDNPFLPAVAGALGNLFVRGVLLGVLLMLQKPGLVPVRSELVISTLYNAALCALIYPLLYRRYDYLHPDPRTVVITGRD